MRSEVMPTIARERKKAARYSPQMLRGVKTWNSVEQIPGNVAK
jgi:hypothetical protein